MTRTIAALQGQIQAEGNSRLQLKIGVLLPLLLLLLVACGGQSDTISEDAIMTDGKALYEQNCTSCHGLAGEGQPDWKELDENGFYPAPPHDESGHTWHHADGLLLEIISQGGGFENSQMPGFAETMTEEDMLLTLAYIKTFWGAQELAFQEEVSAQFEEVNQ